MFVAHTARVLVTGASGFIGSNLVIRLRELGAEAVNLDRAPPPRPEDRALWRECDLLDAGAVARVVRETRPTHAIHLAARTDLDGAELDEYSTNTEGTRHLLDALSSLQSEPRLIVASTRLVCRMDYRPSFDEDYCPPNAYGESKVQTERIVRESGYRGGWAIVRPTAIWGPGFSEPYRDFFLAVSRGRYLYPAGVRVLKSFGYVENTVAQLEGLLAAEPGRIDRRLFYLADYEPFDVADFARAIQAELGAPPVRGVPLALLRGGAAVGDVLHRVGWRSVPLKRSRLDHLLTETLYDLEPIRELVPTLPATLQEGVRRTVEWLRATGALAGGR